MKRGILKKVDEAIQIMKPIIEQKMPYRKWNMHINLFWDNTFTVLFEYKENLSEKNGNKTISHYELCNQFCFSDTDPDKIQYSLIRFTDKNSDVLKKEEISIKKEREF